MRLFITDGAAIAIFIQEDQHEHRCIGTPRSCRRSDGKTRLGLSGAAYRFGPWRSRSFGFTDQWFVLGVVSDELASLSF